MKEKILIKSTKDNWSKIVFFAFLIALGISGIYYYWGNTAVFNHRPHSIHGYALMVEETFFEYEPVYAYMFLVIFLLVSVFCFLIYWSISVSEVVVTEDRIYGTAWFRKNVDLPIDTISAIGTTILNGISVSTSSGEIKFLAIKNENEVRKIISSLLSERQKAKKDSNKVITNVTQEQSSADELKKFKDLLDSGIITQEEFDTKKKQLLGL